VEEPFYQIDLLFINDHVLKVKVQKEDQLLQHLEKEEVLLLLKRIKD